MTITLEVERPYLSFDGVDDYINCGNPSILNNITELSVIVWVKFNYLDYTNGTGKLIGFAGKGWPDSTSPNAGWWFSYDNRNNGKSFTYTCFGNSVGGYAGGGNNFGGSSYYYTFTTDRLYCIGFTIKNSVGRLYIDGVQIGPDKTFSNLVLSDPSRILAVGKLSTSANYHRGIMRQILIYTRGLSAQEMLWNYNNPDAPVTNGLALWFKMDEGSGSTVYDYSGYRNHGTIYGATWNKEFFDQTSRLISLRHGLTSRELERVEFTLANADLRIGQKVRIRRNNNIFFEGIVYERRKRHDQNYVGVEATAYSPLILYDRQVVYRLYQTGTKAGDIIRDLAALEQDVNTLGVDDGPSLLSNWEIENQTALDVMRSIARGTNYWLRMRPAATYLSFDGVDDYVAVPDSSSWKPSSLTAEIWIYPYAWLDQATSYNSHHFYPARDGFGITTSSSNWAYWIKTSAGRQARSVSHGNQLNMWHQAVLTYNQATGDMKFYVDAVLKDTYNLGAGTAIAWGSGVLKISHAPNYATYGRIMCARIYNRALSDYEIQWNYLNPLNPVRSGLVLWLKMNEGKGSMAYDYSGYNNHGTIYGAAWGYEKNPSFVNSYVLEYRPKVIA